MGVDVNANIRNQTEFKNAIHSIAASSTELVKQYDQQNALKNQTQSAKQNMLKVLKDAKLSKKSQEKFEKLLADPNFDKEMFSNFSNDVQQKKSELTQLEEDKDIYDENERKIEDLKNEGVTGGNNNNMMMGNSNNNMDEVVNVEDIEKLEKSIEELKTIDNACQQFMESKNLGKASRQKFLNIFKVLKQINGDVDVNANIRNQTEFKNAIHSIAASSTELVKQYDQQSALKNQTQSAKQNMLKVL